MIAYGVRERNQDRVQVHNVAFGEGADYEFMQQISAENGGIDRRIFDNMDAAVAVSPTARSELNCTDSWLSTFALNRIVKTAQSDVKS